MKNTPKHTILLHSFEVYFKALQSVLEESFHRIIKVPLCRPKHQNIPLTLSLFSRALTSTCAECPPLQCTSHWTANYSLILIVQEGTEYTEHDIFYCQWVYQFCSHPLPRVYWKKQIPGLKFLCGGPWLLEEFVVKLKICTEKALLPLTFISQDILVGPTQCNLIKSQVHHPPCSNSGGKWLKKDIRGQTKCSPNVELKTWTGEINKEYCSRGKS